MRVLVVSNMYPSPARPNWGTFVQSQVDSLRAKGVESDVLVIDGYKGKWRYLTAIPRLMARVASGRYQLIHAHYGLSGLVARMQRRLPIVLSYCGDDLLGHADGNGQLDPRSLPLARLQRRLANAVDQVIVKSAEMRGVLRRPDVSVIPNGVDFDRFRPLDRAACRDELGLDQTTRYIFFPYRIDDHRKNHRAAAAAVKALAAERGEPIELLVVNNVPNDRLPLYYNAADVLVLPSFWEGSPNAVKEALACDLPVVASAVGDVTELLDGVINCHIVNQDAVSVAAGLRAALDGPARSDGRARTARLRTDVVADRVLHVYRAALEPRLRQEPAR